MANAGLYLSPFLTKDGLPAKILYLDNGDGSYTQLVSGTVTAAAPAGAPSLAITQATSTGTAATLVIARSTRRSVLIRNLDPTYTVYVGPATVTSGNGFPIRAGESLPFTWVGLIQIIDDGTHHCAVAVADEY